MVWYADVSALRAAVWWWSYTMRCMPDKSAPMTDDDSTIPAVPDGDEFESNVTCHVRSTTTRRTSQAELRRQARASIRSSR